MELLHEEWFWAMLALLITPVIFILETHAQNKISRADFVYSISSDFGNNDRILRVYQWFENLRRKHQKVERYLELPREYHADIYSGELPFDFIDMDTYINHFESVYVIRRSVKMRNINELFQQRFLCFMFNPLIQREELFTCFLADENDFRLLKLWLRTIRRRNHLNCEQFLAYLSAFTYGNFDFSPELLTHAKARWPVSYRWRVRQYLINYICYLCDPACLYGYYEVSGKNKQNKVLRIIRSANTEAELRDILALQDRVQEAMQIPEWFSPSTPQEIQTALANPRDYACVQVCDGNRLVAFCLMVLNPSPEQDLRLELKKHALPCIEGNACVLDAVFVDPQYRGYGLQRLMVRILCSWAATLGKQAVLATIHPDNRFSAGNFEKNGFKLATPEPIPKYGSRRNIYARPLSRKDAKKAADGTYTVYPYV